MIPLVIDGHETHYQVTTMVQSPGWAAWLQPALDKALEVQFAELASLGTTPEATLVARGRIDILRQLRYSIPKLLREYEEELVQKPPEDDPLGGHPYEEEYHVDPS